MSFKQRYNRRQILQRMACAGASGLLAGVGGKVNAQTGYNGKLLVNLQLIGGLDVTHFADPKVNVAGMPAINNWASQQVLQAGNIAYAPFAQNATFFNKYFQDILVINGIDAQTNSHTVGILHNGSGRNSEGYPTLTALFAAVNQTDLPMPYLNFGGFASTQGITEITQIGRVSVLQNVVEPNLSVITANRYIDDADWELIAAMHKAGLASRRMAPTTLEAASTLQFAYEDSLSRSATISQFADFLPTTLESIRNLGTTSSSLHQQIQISLLAFKAGVSMTADVLENGFDTHDSNDARLQPLLDNVTDAIDYFWEYAAELGLADRLVLVVGSDFGRTPKYNSGAGKDHWPIGSLMVMQKNAGFTNRVVGLTDAGHNTVKINPVTMQADSVNGITLKPAHVHKAFRKQLGLDTAAVTQIFPFSTTEDVAIFG